MCLSQSLRRDDHREEGELCWALQSCLLEISQGGVFVGLRKVEGRNIILVPQPVSLHARAKRRTRIAMRHDAGNGSERNGFIHGSR